MECHTTRDEVKFLRELSNINALRGYIAAAAKRTDWGALQPDIVLTAATRRLAELIKRKGLR